MMKVAFLDRDGVINNDLGYVYKTDDFSFTDGCIEALKILQEKGFALIIVTNQSGIGRGYYTEQDYQHLTGWYLDALSKAGVTITHVYHCPHAPEDGCACRKPNPGLFLQASQDYDIDFSSSLMIGDKFSDMEAAKTAGIQRRYLLGESSAEYRAYNDLFDCVNHVMRD